MSAIGALGSSVRAVLIRPRWWFLALAAFLARGGLILLLVPLIPLPTTAGLANALGPALVGFVFGGPSIAFFTLVATLAGAVAVWLAGSGLIGALIDLRLIREAEAVERITGTDRPVHGNLWHAVLLRWIAHVPTLAVLVWGVAPLVDAGYAELIQPGDPTLPVALRVVLRVPGIVIALFAAWVLGEAVGGLAVRHLAWGSRLRSALASAIRSLLRLSALAVLVITTATLAGALAVGGTVVGMAFEGTRTVLLDDATPPLQWLALGRLSASWFGTALVVSIAAAVRSVAWTFEVARLRQPAAGGPGPLAGVPD